MYLDLPARSPSSSFVRVGWALAHLQDRIRSLEFASYLNDLMVDDLDGALAQVVEGGATAVGEVQDEPYGRFGWFLDPEGNKVELWEPKEEGS